MNLIYPLPTEEPAVAGIGWLENHHLHDRVESVIMNTGERPWDVKESGSRWLETTPKSSKAQVGSQRGHSTRRTGKPSTGGRATAGQVPQSTITPLYTGESRLGGGKETRVMVLIGGRRVR
jgi:hypothetical protein